MNLRLLRPGQQPQVGHWNQFVRAIEGLRREIAALKGAGAAGGKPAALRVWGVNKTGVELRAGDAAALTGSPYTEFAEIVAAGPVVLLGVLDEDAAWGVAADLIPNNSGGWVYVAGVCPARATGEEADGDFLAPPDGGGGVVLARAESGNGRILATLNAGGSANPDETWFLVLLGAGGGAKWKSDP